MIEHVLDIISGNHWTCICGAGGEGLGTLAAHLKKNEHDDPIEPEAETFVIPVAFEIVDIDELMAAKRVAALLGLLEIPVRFPEIHSWWTPNHPSADGSDDEGHRLVWTQAQDSTDTPEDPT